MSTDDGADGRRALLERLVLPWRTVPAVVYDRHLTIRIVNDLARALHRTFRPGANLARSAFLPSGDGARAGSSVDPAGTTPVGARLAAELRRSLDEHHQDRGYVELIGELAARSAAFAQFWAEPDRAEPSGVVGFALHGTGRVVLAYHRFSIPGPDGDTLLLWHGADDTSTGRLAALARSLHD